VLGYFALDDLLMVTQRAASVTAFGGPVRKHRARRATPGESGSVVAFWHDLCVVWLMIEGHCFCGFVRFQADGPISNQTTCHCATCRRTSAAPAVAWLTVAKSKFRIISGKPSSFRSSARVTRSFCPRCGTPLTYANDDADDEVDITIGSLDAPELMPPLDHTWVSAKLPWSRLCDGLPSYPEARTQAART